MTQPIRHALFEASAGTGKTYQVTSLYTALLCGKAFPPDTGEITPGGERLDSGQILLLTFARNAAAELRTRITERIEGALAEAAEDEKPVYSRMLRALAGAPIATIHAFAQKLLAEHALAAGISPSVRIMEEEETSALLSEEAGKVLLRILGGPDGDLRTQLDAVCESTGTARTAELAVTLLRECRQRGIVLAPEKAGGFVTPTPAPTVADLSDIKERAGEAVRLQTAQGCAANAAQEFCDECSRLLSALPGNANALLVADAAGELLAGLKKSWGAKQKAVREETKQRLGTIAAYADHVRAEQTLRAFIRYTATVSEAVEQRKNELAVLDYDDLILKALDLVGRRPSAVDSFRALIVDEAQDNSRVQNKLIQAIQKASGAALVLCGDRKQSIYTWRSAEPGGMSALAESLADTLRIPLNVSYRSQKQLLEWINSLAGSEPLFGSDYTPDEHLAPNKDAENTAGPNVELLLSDWEYGTDPNALVTVPAGARAKNEPCEKRRFELTHTDLKRLSEAEPDAQEWKTALKQYEARVTLEARAMARRIKLLCGEASSARWRPRFVWDSRERNWAESSRKYRLRDVLILLRASTRQDVYETALRELNIRYTTDGRGRGFYFRQEVRDIVSLLSWLARPTDDLALLAVLRSPFAGLSDSAIAVLSRASRKRLRGYSLRFAVTAKPSSMRRHAEALRKLGLEEEAGVYERTHTVLNHLRGLAGRITAVDLVREAIRLTGFDAVSAGQFHGAQKLANMRKLLSLIQDTERRKNLDLSALARWLTEKMGTTDEADAPVFDVHDDAVRINTVHAAKGLDSPVVIIPDLRLVSRNRAAPFVVRESDSPGGFRIAAGFNLPAEDGAGEKCVTHDFEQADNELKERMNEEAKRLFYVGVTRPRDLLVFSGETPERQCDQSWRGSVNRHLNALLADGPDRMAELLSMRPHQEIATACRRLAAEEEKKPEVTVDALRGVAECIRRPIIPEAYRFPATALAHIPAPDDGSGAAEGSDEGRLLARLRRKVCLGFKGPVSVDRGGESNEPSCEDPALVGELGHAVLEQLDFPAGRCVADMVRECVGNVGIAPAIAGRLNERLPQIAGKMRSELKGADVVIRELPFCARFTHGQAECIVDGQIDLLYLKNSIWHMVDYKFTDALGSRLAERYALQLLIYRDAISEPAGDLRRLRIEEARTPARLRMMIVGIDVEGNISEADVTDDIPADEVARRVIAAARLLRRATTVTPETPACFALGRHVL